MGTVDKQGVVTMQELLVSSLAQTDALTKLLIEKGVITEAEFMQKLSTERAGYQAMVQKVNHLRCQKQSFGGSLSLPVYYLTNRIIVRKFH